MKLGKLNLPLIITLLLFGAFVVIPMGSAFEYSIRRGLEGGYGLQNYLWAVREEDFSYYLIRSTWLSAVTVLITLVILVPTLTWIHLSNSKLRELIDGLSLLPLVIPVVAFAVGAQISFPEFIQSSVMELPFLYFILALPYAYRALDIGLKAIPLKTLSEAARSAGASWLRAIVIVILPVIRSAVTATIALTFALSIGEFTMTVLLHWDTFPTWVTYVAQDNLLGAIAISMIALLVPFVLISLVALLTPEKEIKESN
ncbi:MAG: ABC transporter permease subunit [Actinobacteria bacterium]|nr:ABC transporter permease subunit [Actinomycetota bacterium]NBO07020.1 ABC transporter permease subunit [Actinomycetota bacterium]NBO47254.1 ABC transporter permease subunit [Actinomycetota bacterium]NBP12049.1 ABC transporter permease subunit [Actinomycetota bacterium]NBP22361.1 ABC transporter permease subunit [Actinomycetota bacterium]